jgi:hypothetical protein
LHGFDFLFCKEPVAFARLQVLTERFFVKFRHELPGPNAQTETQTPLNTLSSILCEVWSQLQCRGSYHHSTEDGNWPRLVHNT